MVFLWWAQTKTLAQKYKNGTAVILMTTNNYLSVAKILQKLAQKYKNAGIMWGTNTMDQISPIKRTYHQLKGKGDKPLSLETTSRSEEESSIILRISKQLNHIWFMFTISNQSPHHQGKKINLVAWKPYRRSEEPRHHVISKLYNHNKSIIYCLVIN